MKTIQTKYIMRLSATLLLGSLQGLSLLHTTAGENVCLFNEHPLPVNSDDQGEPHWKQIIEIAFPPWDLVGDCPRLDKVGGMLADGYNTFPDPQAKKFNPCYYTKAFAGLDPMKGGYPTPIDTKYPYEFAAPFFKQPGDGSTHHCPINASPDTPVQSCPKVAPKCDGGVKDCNKVTDEFGIGHVPPFVPLAAVKNAYINCGEDIHSWFNDDVDPCNIKKSVLDRLIFDTFGTTDGTVKFTPPIILDDVPAGDPKSTYYKLEYLDDPVACTEITCKGPHYCSNAAAEADIWRDFCPYIHTGENSGQYRHPHVALAALELWIANKVKPTECPATWLDSPNAKGYGEDGMTSTSITWAEMDDNTDQIAQPAVPYMWPNSGNGIYPGHELYGESSMKPAPGLYVTRFVAESTDGTGTTSGGVGLSSAQAIVSATIATALAIVFM